MATSTTRRGRIAHSTGTALRRFRRDCAPAESTRSRTAIITPPRYRDERSGWFWELHTDNRIWLNVGVSRTSASISWSGSPLTARDTLVDAPRHTLFATRARSAPGAVGSTIESVCGRIHIRADAPGAQGSRPISGVGAVTLSILSPPKPVRTRPTPAPPCMGSDWRPRGSSR